VDRRSFLGALAAIGSAGLAPERGCTSASRLPTELSYLKRIGLQLYTVRDEMAANFEGTLARVAAIGYREVEFAGYLDRNPRAVRAILDQNGLVAPSAHIPIELLRTKWRAALDDAQVVGHRFLVIPWIPAEERRTLDDYKRVAELFNRAGAEAKAVGVGFAYHNHDFEFARVNGQLPYDILLTETDPALVAMELDLYWITKGARDPLDYFARHPGRFPLVHVKDSGGAPRHEMVEVGRGTIDWKRIFARQEQAGIKHAFVEHDEPADPLGFARASYEYLSRLAPESRPAAPRGKTPP
jgi:sugar phosphate isomerase/epimerase